MNRHPAVEHFIEQLGLATESEGLSRTAGRLLAYLLLAPEPVPFEELAAELKVSRGGVSANTRLLEERGVVERVARPGDRRVYYRITADVFGNLIEGRLHRRRRIREILAEARREIPPELGFARERLAGMDRFYRFLIERLERTVEDWRAEHPQSEAPGEPDRKRGDT